MKRMYVTLGLILLVLISAVTCLGQMSSPNDQFLTQSPDTFNRLKRRMELREEMHKRMRDKILHGIGSDENIFEGMEDMFEDALSDSMTIKASANFSSEWTESKTGRILIITPKTKDQQLNIDVNNEMITIKGKTEEKNDYTSVSSSFSNSFSVPNDCDGSKVKMDQKDGKILIELPFKGAAKVISLPPKKEERKPIPPMDGEITI